MMTSRFVAISLVLFGCQCRLALAQADGSEVDSQPLTEGSMTYFTTEGEMVRKALSDDAIAQIMRNGAVPITAGVLIMKHGGKMYMVGNHKMHGGRMISDLAAPAMPKR